MKPRSVCQLQLQIGKWEKQIKVFSIHRRNIRNCEKFSLEKRSLMGCSVSSQVFQHLLMWSPSTSHFTDWGLSEMLRTLFWHTNMHQVIQSYLESQETTTPTSQYRSEMCFQTSHPDHSHFLMSPKGSGSTCSGFLLDGTKPAAAMPHSLTGTQPSGPN